MKLIVFLMLFLVGCVTVGRPIDPNNLARIQVGITTEAEVVQIMGTPDNVSKDGNGNSYLTYVYVPAGSKSQSQAATIAIGADGKVSNIISNNGAYDTNTGIKVE